MNPMPDPEFVYAANILGVVKNSIPELGFTLLYISENIGFIFIIFIGLAISAVLLGMVFKGVGKKREKDRQKLVTGTV